MSYHDQMTTRMASAVSAGKHVIIQPTFATIPEQHAPRLSNLNERNGLSDIFGCAAAKWQQDHYQQYEMFQVGSLDRLISVARAFKDHKNKGDITIDRLMVSQHRTLQPWLSFCPQTTEGQAVNTTEDSHRLHIRDVFEAVRRSAERQPYRNLIPALAPVLRTGLSAVEPVSGKPLKPYHISTNSLRTVALGGESVRLRDMLIVKDADLKQRIEDAPSFSLVATPYLQRWSIAGAISSAREHRLSGYKSPLSDVKPVCMFWHIESDQQVSGCERQVAFDF